MMISSHHEANNHLYEQLCNNHVFRKALIYSLPLMKIFGFHTVSAIYARKSCQKDSHSSENLGLNQTVDVLILGGFTFHRML